MSDDSYTAEEHLAKADGALAAAIKIKQRQDGREADRGQIGGKTSPGYLADEHDLLTLLQIVNTHANMATAKSLAHIARHFGPRTIVSG